VLACQIVLEDDARRDQIADKAQDQIWRLWSEVGQQTIRAWQWQQQNTVLDLRQAALADAIFGAEPFVDRALDRARMFQSTGAMDAYDRILATIGAVQPPELSARAFALLAPQQARVLFLQPVPEAQRPPPGVVGVPGNEVTLASVAKAARPGWDHGRPDGMSAGLEETYYYEPPTVTWSYASHAAIVEVDINCIRIRVCIRLIVS